MCEQVTSTSQFYNEFYEPVCFEEITPQEEIDLCPLIAVQSAIDGQPCSLHQDFYSAHPEVRFFETSTPLLRNGFRNKRDIMIDLNRFLLAEPSSILRNKDSSQILDSFYTNDNIGHQSVDQLETTKFMSAETMVSSEKYNMLWEFENQVRQDQTSKEKDNEDIETLYEPFDMAEYLDVQSNDEIFPGFVIFTTSFE